MTYTLVALFLLTGHQYVEVRHLSLNQCAGRAAMIRQEMLSFQSQMEGLVGEIRYLCQPETK